MVLLDNYKIIVLEHDYQSKINVRLRESINFINVLVTSKYHVSTKLHSTSIVYYSHKISYAASERNKSFILDVLRKHVDPSKPGNVLEISSGTGQQLIYFAQHFPNLTFQPSEFDRTLFASIRAYKDETPTTNVRDPLRIDVTTDCNMWNTHVPTFDYIINVNLMHISPFECTVGLFRNAGKILKPDGLMFTYGPYARDGVIEPQSNIDFDKSLKRQNPKWGLRDIQDLERQGDNYGVKLLHVYDLPANNKCLVWQKTN